MGVKDSFLGRLLGSADKFSDEQVLQTISMLVEHGVHHRASDIHIEPRAHYVLVRYRIDGTLKGVHKLPLAALPNVVRQLKSLAHLDESRDQVPQEGQYSTLVDGEDFEIQVSFLPVIGGEKTVLHIARHLTQPPKLEDLGFWGSGLQSINLALSRTHGLLLAAAPRRNGITTTLHSMLHIVNVPSVSVATVESAIEFRLSGANQTQVRPHRGITFHDGLQAAMNQDPNIILVSSLPDRQTASKAVQAAASGHMVLAGVHADDAATALTYVRSLGDEPYLLASATRIVISQRLVRRLCEHCRERYIPSQEQLAELYEAFGIETPAAHRRVHELEQRAAREGIDPNIHVNTTPAQFLGLWRAGDAGCEYCDHSGYQGVTAINEVLEVSESVQKALLGHESAQAIRKEALDGGFIPMALDGLVKSLRGVTTVAEVLRTAGNMTG